jgi:CRISPR system Cascade subunit CasB
MTTRTGSLGEIARGWWRQTLAGETGPQRAARARLRRAHDAHAALTEAAAVALAIRLGATGRNDREREARTRQALALATVLAHVKEETPQALMRALGHRTPPGAKEAETPLLARARFDRIMRADPDELPAMLIRLVRQLGGTANIAELADALIWWPNEKGRARIQRKWAFDYFAAPTSNPDSADMAESTETFA